jgi:hypothetical protein
VIELASNQVEERNKARRAYEDAVKAQSDKQTIARLKAVYDDKQAIVESTTGGSGGGGILS